MKNHYQNFNLTEKSNPTPYRVKMFFLPLMLAIAVIALPPNKADAQAAPTLSYSSPQTYSLNAKITPLAPTSSGVATPAYSTTAVNINTGLSSPFGVATDAAGNLYVSDLATQIVKEFPAGGGTPVIIGSGEFSHPEGITVDAAGNVYAAGDYNGMVAEILKSDGSVVNSGTGFNEFSDVAVDAAGNVYVADFSNSNSVKEILKSNGNTVAIGNGFSNYVISIATDAAGNVYIADTHNGISEILASNGNTISLGSGFSNPQGVAVDAVGNVFVSDQGNGAIKEIPVGSSTPVTLVSGLTNPGQIAVDGAGNIYFVDTTSGTVQEIKPIGGYYINALPQGLSFSNSTGVISGTTTANVPPTNYTVTAYNAGGSASAIVNITVGTPPAPTLSYQSPQIYTTGAVISPLMPSTTGVSSTAYTATKTAVGTGYNDDQAVATDAAGNVYVTDQYHNEVFKIPAGGGTQVPVATNLTGGVYGVAVDALGNLYVSESNTNTVSKIPAGGGSPVPIGTGFKGPDGLAVDAAGNVYVADHSNDAIKEILASDGSTKTLASGLGYPYGVAVDAAGNVYIAATYNNKVLKLPAGGSTPIPIGTGFSTPESVAVDAIGNVYVSDFDSKTVKMIAVGGSTTTIPTTFSYPQGVAVDGAGNVYLADAGADVVYQVKPIGGYYLSSALPAGLSFNGVTGAISGTPSVVSAATDYTVTGYNVTGSAKATVNLKVVAPVTITSITRQSAALTNTYYAGYTVVFGGPVTGLKPSNFSVTTSGITGASVNYISGSGNTYTVVAFTGAGDGTVTLNMANDLGMQPGVSTALPFAGDTYTIDKTPPSASPLIFSSDNANYAIANIGNTVSLAFGSGEAIQTPVVTIGGHNITAVSTGTNTYKASYTMTAGDTYGRVHFTLSMTDLAGNTSTYNDVAAGDDVEFVKQTSSGDATANVKISPNATLTGTLFTTPENDYTTSVPAATSSITVTATPNDPTSTVTVNGIAVASGAASQAITLNAAGGQPTVVTTVITSQLGNSKSYVVSVSRNGSSDAIANVKISPNATLTGTLFTTPENDYTTSVPAVTSSITVTTTPDDPTSTVMVNGIAVANGAASQAIALNAAGGQPTVVTTVITSETGNSKSYVVSVSRNGSSDATANVKISPNATLTGTLFTTPENDYTTSVPAATSSIMVTATPDDPTSTVMVNGTAVANGAASQAIALNAAGGQPTVVTTVITSETGNSKSYVVSVSRNGSSDATANVKVSPNATLTGTLYTASENDYTASVSAATSSVTITATPIDPASTVEVNGIAVANAAASQAIALNAAGGQPTVITTVITSISGVTKSYVIAITRPAPVGLALLKTSEIPENVLATTDGIVVHNGVSPNGDGIDDFLRIEGIGAYPANKLSIMNRNGSLVYEASGYDNNTRVFDGHSNKTGALQLPGTYFYSLEYTVDNIVKHKTGFIVLKY